MLKKILLAISLVIATMGFAYAQVDVNKADLAALDGIKGIGPKLSKTIVDERKKGGNFKDWADFEKRVKGIGDKSSDNLSKSGLTVNGQSKPNAPAVASAKPDAQKDGKGKEAKAAKTSAASPAAAAPAAKQESAKNGADSKSKGKKDQKVEKSDKADKGDKTDKASAPAAAKK